jgi:hypothetical protein
MQVTFVEISRIFLSALLAAFVWFMLTQGTTTNNLYFLAVGLATREIVNSIVKSLGRLGFSTESEKDEAIKIRIRNKIGKW